MSSSWSCDNFRERCLRPRGQQSSRPWGRIHLGIFAEKEEASVAGAEWTLGVCGGWLSWAWRWRHSLIGGALGAIIRNKKKKADIWSFKNKHDTNLFYILKVYSGLCVEDQPYGWQYWRQEILQGLLQCSGKKWWSPRPGDNRHREMWMYLAS